MTIKKGIENLLRNCPPLFRLGSAVYHKLNGSFKTLSAGTPEAIKRAFELSLQNNDNKIKGNYFEFGLFRGYTFLKAYEYSKELGIANIHYFGFDSFKGLPEITGVDIDDGRFFEGQFSCSKENVEKNLNENGMDLNKMTLIEGYYSDSLTEQLHQEHDFQKASVILLDCDLYSSTTDALNWLSRYLQNGTIILFDDWYTLGEDKELAQQKALKDFKNSNQAINFETLWDFSQTGKAFLVKM